MAMTQCPECGNNVSSMAPTCPQCGYPIAAPAAAAPPSPPAYPPPKKSGTSPWTIIGWILLVFLLLFVYSCYRAVSNNVAEARGSTDTLSTAASAPQYSVQVISTECTGNYGRDRAEITVRNTGASIPFAKGFVQFVDGAGALLSAQDSYFSPSTIPAGATASVTVYSSGGGAARCGLTTIQDGDGNPVTISAG